MLLLSKFDKVIRFLLSVIDIYGKYTSFIPLKDKKSYDGPRRKPKKIWVDKGIEF